MLTPADITSELHALDHVIWRGLRLTRVTYLDGVTREVRFNLDTRRCIVICPYLFYCKLMLTKQTIKHSTKYECHDWLLCVSIATTPSSVRYILLIYFTDYQKDSRHLQHVQTSLVDTAACATAWTGNANVTDDMLCAGGNRAGTCQVYSFYCIRRTLFWRCTSFTRELTIHSVAVYILNNKLYNNKITFKFTILLLQRRSLSDD